MKMPDVTKIQFAVIGKLIVALILAIGLPLDTATQAEIIGVTGLVGSFLVAADALIRYGRSKIAANPQAYEQVRQLPPPTMGS